MPHPLRRPELSESLRRQLNSYALAASAAGVSLLALAQPGEAKIIYTPAHKKISPNHTVLLDLNRDGRADFSFRNALSTTSVGSFRSDRLSILPQGSNQIWGHRTGSGLHYASALRAGVRVGASGAFSAGSRSMAYGRDDVGSYYCEGKWNNVARRYLGLKFTFGGNTHFGWARLNVSCNLYKVNALLTGYAYETVPNQPIITGKTHGPDVVTVSPSALGELAQGASAIQAWRRKKLR
jgi:hypothetical protein